MGIIAANLFYFFLLLSIQAIILHNNEFLKDLDDLKD